MTCEKTRKSLRAKSGTASGYLKKSLEDKVRKSTSGRGTKIRVREQLQLQTQERHGRKIKTLLYMRGHVKVLELLEL